MKRILSVVAVALLVLGIGYRIYNDPEVQKRLPTNTSVSTTNTAERWANALCSKDAETVSILSGGYVAMSVEEVTAALQGFPDCTVRALGVVHGQYGDEYFFAIDMGEFEVWYGLTVEDGLVTGVE